MHTYWNLPSEQLSFYFLTFFPVSLKKKNLNPWEQIKLGELPRHNAPRVLLLGEMPQNTQINKKEVVYKVTKRVLCNLVFFHAIGFCEHFLTKC
jgi:hypothetical protein